MSIDEIMKTIWDYRMATPEEAEDILARIKLMIKCYSAENEIELLRDALNLAGGK